MSSVLPETIKMRLTAVHYAAETINLYEFAGLENQVLPTAEPGAHIGLHLPNGLLRQYSLHQADERPHAYHVGIKFDRNSRGGSSYVHENLRVGALLDVEPPRNNFPLAETAEESVFIAGGIGITPIYAMLRRLEDRGRKWRLHYACRSRAEAAFYNELQRFAQVEFHFDDEQGKFFDCAGVIENAAANWHLYCCGPAAMLEAFDNLTQNRLPSFVHAEYFTAKHAVALDGGYTVELARSGQTFVVPAGQTILQVLLAADVDVPFSCEEGVCGSCETKVISGVPDHRDAILSEAERLANKTMMVCCSGAKSPKLVLDL